MRCDAFFGRGPRRGFVVLGVFVSSLAFSPCARAQGGLPPGAAATVRAGMSRPRITGIGPSKGVTMGPGPCFVRDASVVLTGGDFGASADGRRLMASSRGVQVALVPVLSWAAHRIEAKLDLAVSLEGETITLDLLDARGESATLGGGTPFLVCYRDQTFLGGNVRIPACSSETREFRIVATGAGRLEKSVFISPHAATARYGFPSLAVGSWAVSVSEVALHPTPTPRPGALPHPGALPIGPPSSSLPRLPGCNALSLGFDPSTQTIVISDARRRATGVDFVELLLSLPSPADLPRAFGNTPTPNPLVVPPSSLPVFHLPPTVTPTVTPTPAR
jgi:hypothetical protein